MSNLFDSFSLGRQFAQSATSRSLDRVASAITSGGALFDRMLLNDEAIREETKTHKDGIDWDRERLSGLISKVQNLQGRLQAVYQSMLDRIMSANSAESGTNQQFTDPWTDTQWRIAGGRLPFVSSRGGHTDGDLQDDMALQSNNLGRMDFWRPTPGGGLYEERGGFYTTTAYLNQWDLHQLSVTYQTGSEPAVASQTADVKEDDKVQVVAVDYAKTKNINWQKGQTYPLDPADIFTPEFLDATAIGGGKGYGDINYQNGSGYQFVANSNYPVLYAYVRDVQYYPDGITVPTDIVMLKDPQPIEDAAGNITNAVHMTYLRNITHEDYDFNLKDDYNFSPTLINADGTHGTSGWIPDTPQAYHFDDNDWVSPAGGTGFDHSVWAGTHYDGSGFWGGLGEGQWSDVSATFRNSWQFNDDPLRHPTFSYDAAALGWNVQIDDFGQLKFWNGSAWETWMTDNVAGSPGTGLTGSISSMNLMQNTTYQLALDGWNRKASWIWRGISFPTTPPWPDHQDFQDYNGNWGESPDGLGWPTYEFRGIEWRDGGAGMQIDNGIWDLSTIKPESAPGLNDGDLNYVGIDRYVIDRYGDIYDKFGKGDTKADFYEYTLDPSQLTENGKLNYVGNIFGNKNRVAQRTKVDTDQNNTLSPAESQPVIQFSSRDYNKPDETINLPAVGSMTAPWDPVAADPATAGSFGTTTLSAFNPSFAQAYVGFAEKASVTLGQAALHTDAYGNSMNNLIVTPFRTADSLSSQYWATSGDDALDRDYDAVQVGDTVNITDHNGTMIDAQAKIVARNPDGSYVVSPFTGSPNSPAVILEPGQEYHVVLPPQTDARTGGTLDNSLTTVLKGVLTGSEYRDALRAGLLDDLMLSASSTDPFSGMLSGKLSIMYNKKQERLELFQNSLATVYKSERANPVP